MPGVVELQAEALADGLVLFRWVASLAVGLVLLGILVWMAAARSPLPVYVMGS